MRRNFFIKSLMLTLFLFLIGLTTSAGTLALSTVSYLSTDDVALRPEISTSTTISTQTSTSSSMITITSPNGGEYWITGLVGGAKRTITWTSSGITGQVRIDLSRDGGTTWRPIGYSSNDGEHPWTPPGHRATTEARIRVVSVKNPDIRDESDANFTIALPSLTVVSPNGGEQWVIGTTQTITWKSNYATFVGSWIRVLLSVDGGKSWRSLIDYTPPDGNFSWKVTGPATTRAKIRVWQQDRYPRDESDAVFTIAKP